MNRTELNEAVALTVSVLNSLVGLIGGPATSGGAQLKYSCGLLQQNAAMELSQSPDGDLQFWIDLATCFDLAQAIGPTFTQMESVRSAVDAVSTIGLPATAVKNYCVRMALVEQARILAATTFVSRQDIDNVFNQINASFSEAELIAADNLDNVAYVALLQLHAAVSNDLANRSRPLARIVTYTYPNSRSVLAMAQNLYQDPSRYQDLIDENKPIHPLFMPRIGEALSS